MCTGFQGRKQTQIPNQESNLELQSMVAPSVEYVTSEMVPTQEAIPEEGGWKKSKKQTLLPKTVLAVLRMALQ